MNVAGCIIWRRVCLKLTGKFLHKYLQGAILKYWSGAGVNRLFGTGLPVSGRDGALQILVSLIRDPAHPRGEPLPEPLLLHVFLKWVVLFCEAN